MIELLRKMGLSEGEIKVYDALLWLGLSSTNDIHERIRIERRSIYDILNKLIGRGLVTYMEENKKKKFQLADPSKLVSYLEEKKASIDNLKIQVEQELPKIKSIFKEHKPKIFTEIYRGQEGIKTIWQEMLMFKEIRWLGSGNYVPKRMPAFWQHWNKQRLKKKIISLHLFRDEIRASLIPNVGKVKFLPPEFSGNPTVIAIFGNKVVNFLFGEEMLGFVIESKELADNYRTYHQYLWEYVARE